MSARFNEVVGASPRIGGGTARWGLCRALCQLGPLSVALGACQPSLGGIVSLGPTESGPVTSTTSTTSAGDSANGTSSSSSGASSGGSGESATVDVSGGEGGSTSTTGSGPLCDLSPGAWAIGEATLIEAINTPYIEWDPFLRGDGLALYFSSNSPDGDVAFDTYLSTRPSREQPFGPAKRVSDPGWNQGATVEGGITLRDDGLEVILSRGDGAEFNLWRSVRASSEEPFESWELLPGLSDVHDPHLSGDGLSLYMVREVDSNFDLYATSRAGVELPWEAPAPLLGVNTGSSELSPSVSGDERVLVFTRGVDGHFDLFVARRDGRDMPFAAAEPLLEINTLGHEREPFLADSDGSCELYFSALRGGDWAIYRAPLGGEL